MSNLVKKRYKYDIEYVYAKGINATDFKKVLERLFKKFLIEYDNC